SGLACADQLNKKGHLVTVFERNDRVGGLLQYGIPTMKLSKQVVQRRVDLMAEEGIEFKTSVNVGKDITGDDLLKNFNAVCLTTGATWPRDLPIPGRQLNGIYFAMTFLESSQKQLWNSNNNFLHLTAKDKKVIVVGGGDTGCDCIGTSLRQGAKNIVSFEILPRPGDTRGADNPWPQWPRIYRKDYGHEEVELKWGSDPRIFGINSKEFLDDGAGNVKGIRSVRVEWTQDNGRWIMKEVPNSEQIYEADLVLLAMGFLGPETYLTEQLRLTKDQRSNVLTKAGTYRTPIDRIYAAGDCRRGQSLVVHAINEGRQAAREIDADLHNGMSTLPGPGGVIPYPPIALGTKLMAG
ncbi:unnamed protein product, partial [Oppiella nova]